MLIWSSIDQNLIRAKAYEHGIDQNQFSVTNNISQIKEANILFGQIPMDKVPLEKIFDWVQVDSVDVSYIKGIQVHKLTNIKGLFSIPIAESTIGSILAFYRGLYLAHTKQKEKNWQRWPLRSQLHSLYGKEILLLGGGSIASRIIHLLQGYQCTFTVFRRQNSNHGLKDAKIITNKSVLKEIINKFPLIINSLPKADSTKGFFCHECIDQMQSETLFVNVGRGDTVAEDYLIYALKKQKFMGAILDVTIEEPIPTESSLWTVPNLILTHHTFGGIYNEPEIKAKNFVQNLARYLSNQQLNNEVEPC